MGVLSMGNGNQNLSAIAPLLPSLFPVKGRIKYVRMVKRLMWIRPGNIHDFGMDGQINRQGCGSVQTQTESGVSGMGVTTTYVIVVCGALSSIRRNSEELLLKDLYVASWLYTPPTLFPNPWLFY